MNLAKPSGVTLKEHTEHVVAEAENYISNRGFVFEKGKQLLSIDFQNSLIKACRYHDLGKKHKKWQDACQKDFQAWKQGNKRAVNISNAEVRHELQSVKICDDNNTELLPEERVAILTHHGKLSEAQYQIDKWEKWCNGDTAHLYKECKQLDYKHARQPFSEKVLTGYRFDLLRATLQFADKRASAKEDFNEVLPYKKFDYTFKTQWKKRPVQEIAEQFAGDDLLLLRAPTGAGKTDAALLWANQQINVLKRADRLVIALPTRFTSNALALNISSTISETGIYHSTSKLLASQSKLANQFSRLLEMPATVCTIDHLLVSLTKTKEDHHQIFFNLSNACLVIDEADFYDDFTQANLLVLLKALKTLKAPILLMSASLPESCLQLYHSTGYQISQIREDTSDLDRSRCKVTAIFPYEAFDEISNILDRATNQPTIIYVNTVDKAVRLKQWFDTKYPLLEDTTLLYHSRYTEGDKMLKEKALLALLGKEAWETNNAKGIAILTQIGEMSVNISADLMISEICPIDRLVQRAGRLSRFKNEAGELILLLPEKDGVFYPAPYGRFNKKEKSWVPYASLQETMNLMEMCHYSANDFVRMVNKVYAKGVVFSDEAIRNARILEKMVHENWLILPAFHLDEGKESGHWRSRDITGQTIVFTITPGEKPEYLLSYLDFEKLKNERGVSAPIYLRDQLLKAGKLVRQTISVNGEEESVVLMCQQDIYSFDYGLDLSLPTVEDAFL